MNAIIIAVGDELLRGSTVDSNSAFLSRELTSRGISVLKHMTVCDDVHSICVGIQEASNASDAVIVTGGLGPTLDDLTRYGLAEAMGVKVTCRDECLQEIQAFFTRRGRRMVDANRVQACIPDTAIPLQNANGTAPGIYAQLEKSQVFILPGVPSEMRSMFENHVVPKLPVGKEVFSEHLMHSFGAGESDIAHKIGDLMARDANPLIGITVSSGLITLRVKAKADSKDQAEDMIKKVAEEIRRRLGELLVGENGETLASATGRLLLKKKATVAAAESCTGGLIGKLFTDVPGSSGYYAGGVVAYRNNIKLNELEVEQKTLAEQGAVSEAVASEMASGIRKLFCVDWALSTTGIAGPGGGTEKKPVGLVCFALAGEKGVETFHRIFPGNRDSVRKKAAFCAINALRLKLLSD